MPLAKTQAHFKALMLDEPEALETIKADFASQFEEGRIPLQKRLNVYRNNIMGGITENIIAAFPLLENLLGLEYLEGLVRSFIMKRPPAHGNLNHYGEGLPAFIETLGLIKSMSYIADIARLEAAQNHAYFAPDDEALTAEDLQNMDLENLDTAHLPLRASCAMLHSPHALLTIRDFCAAQRDEGATLDLNGAAQNYLLISRPHLEVKITNLTPDEFTFLNALAQKKPLGEALENALSNYPDFNVQQALQKHLTLQTFSKQGTTQ